MVRPVPAMPGALAVPDAFARIVAVTAGATSVRIGRVFAALANIVAVANRAPTCNAISGPAVATGIRVDRVAANGIDNSCRLSVYWAVPVHTASVIASGIGPRRVVWGIRGSANFTLWDDDNRQLNAICSCDMELAVGGNTCPLTRGDLDARPTHRIGNTNRSPVDRYTRA